MFFNTVYVWPKMLAGALALAALAILLSRDPGDRWRGAGVLTAVLAVLSVLAHGGTVFALLAFVPFLVPLRRKVTAAGLAGCSGRRAALYLPWMMYQRFVAPPGDRVVKWILAGAVAIDRRGTAQTIVDQYRSLSPAQLLGNKWDNVMTLVANPMVWHRQVADAGWAGGFFGYARIAGINDLVPAAARCCSAPSRWGCRRPAAGSRPPGRSRGSRRSPSRPGPRCSGAGRARLARSRRRYTRDHTRPSSCSSGSARSP